MPPPPPPPPPPPLSSSTPSSVNTGLLSEIGNFRKGGLKKTTTNDRSAPLCGNSNNTTTNNNDQNRRNSTLNRSNGNERSQTAPMITPNLLNSAMLRPCGTTSSTIKVKKPSVAQVIPPPPPPVHQPVVKAASFDQCRNGVDSIISNRSFNQQAPRLPPREPPPPPPSNETKPKLGQTSSGSQQRITRAPPPPPPPPPYSPTKTGLINSDNSSKLCKQNSPTAPPPLPPPRGSLPTMNNGIIRRPHSDFVDHSSSDRRYDPPSLAELHYDYHFESRFRFLALEHLPIPSRWHQPPPIHSRSSKHHLNVR